MFRRLLSDDWPRKLVAVIFAVACWLVVNQHISVERTFHDVPVRVTTPDGLALVTDMPAVWITVRGANQDVSALSPTDLYVEYYVGDDATDGTHIMALRAKHVPLERGVRVSEIKPSKIPLTLDSVIEKEVPVSNSHRHLFESVPDRMGLRTINIVPETVTVTGPSRHVNAIHVVQIDKPIRLDSNPPMNLEVDSLLRKYPNVSLSNTTVNLYFEFYNRTGTRVFQDLPVHVLPPVPKGLSASLVQAAITSLSIYGPRNVLDILTDESFRLFVDLGAISSPGTYERPVRIWITARDCYVDRITPVSLPLRVEFTE
ncbi:MAG TPA: hypothetical protein DCR55_10225 [Lentisphaeria bacterium]|nr:hypothetical protein [Lentisphaeria bacterium]